MNSGFRIQLWNLIFLYLYFTVKTQFGGRTGLIFDYIHGESMLFHFTRKPWHVIRLARKMAIVHQQLHHAIPQQIPDQKYCTEMYISKTPILANDKKEKIIEYLRKLDSGFSLCHGDMHPDNILFSENGPMVIDWMSATRGNPAGDVAKSVVILKYTRTPDHFKWHKRLMTNLIKRAFCELYLRKYISTTGIQRKEIESWILPVAAARLSEFGPDKEKKALVRLINRELMKKKLLKKSNTGSRHKIIRFEIFHSFFHLFHSI